MLLNSYIQTSQRTSNVSMIQSARVVRIRRLLSLAGSIYICIVGPGLSYIFTIILLDKSSGLEMLGLQFHWESMKWERRHGLCGITVHFELFALDRCHGNRDSRKTLA